MKFDNINLEELREEARNDDATNVRTSLKGLVGALDHAIQTADDPDDLVELIKWVTEQIKAGKIILRDHKPIKELTAAGPNDTFELNARERMLIDQIRARYGGDLIGALQAQKDERDGFERDLNVRTRELSDARHNSIDAGQAQTIREQEATIADLERQLAASERRADGLQAALDSSPKDQEVLDLLKVLKTKGGLTTTNMGRKEWFRIETDSLSDKQEKLLGLDPRTKPHGR